MSVDPSWELYGTFLEVMRGGSLSSASRALLVAQPTVRRRIEALEEALGVVLFTRAQNGLVATEAASAILPYAESMHATAKALTRAASGASGAARGTVRVTTSEVVGAEVMPAILVKLREVHPQIEIELVLSNRNQDLLRRDADVAVRMIAPTQSALVGRRVGEVPLGLFASEGYVAAHGAPARAADLASHALVGPDRDPSFVDRLAAMGVAVSARSFVLRSDSDLAQLAAIRAGLGIGICQVPLAARGQPLVRVVPEIATALEVWVVVHEDLRNAGRVRAVFDHLVDSLSGHVAGRRTAAPGARGGASLASPSGERGRRPRGQR